MVTVVLTVRLDMPGVVSLKEKRRILKSLIVRLRNAFNISVSEIDLQDRLRSAHIAAAIVCNDSAFAHSVMAKVVNKIQGESEAMLIDYATETY